MTTPSTKIIIDIDVSNLCHESFPCQHHVTVYYDDGTKETKMFVHQRSVKCIPS